MRHTRGRLLLDLAINPQPEEHVEQQNTSHRHPHSNEIQNTLHSSTENVILNAEIVFQDENGVVYPLESLSQDLSTPDFSEQLECMQPTAANPENLPTTNLSQITIQSLEPLHGDFDNPLSNETHQEPSISYQLQNVSPLPHPLESLSQDLSTPDISEQLECMQPPDANLENLPTTNLSQTQIQSQELLPPDFENQLSNETHQEPSISYQLQTVSPLPYPLESLSPDLSTPFISEQLECIQPPDANPENLPTTNLSQTQIQSQELWPPDFENQLSNETHQEPLISYQLPTVSTSEERNASDPDQEKSTTSKMRKRGRKRTKEWDRQRTKDARMKGEEFIGFRGKSGITSFSHDVNRASRIIGIACESDYCKKSTKRNCDKIPQDARINIFDKFWKMSWTEKKVYISNLVEVKPKNRETVTNENRKRESTCNYYLYCKQERLQVCKKMFLATLGLKEWMVRNWAVNSEGGIPERPKERRARRNVGAEGRKYFEEWLDNLPKLESHYCRKDTTKLYLEAEIASMKELYRLYINKAEQDKVKPVSVALFNKIFHEKNFALFQPRKDQCDICLSYKKGNTDKTVYDEHIKAKDIMRAEKEKDKKTAIDGKCYTLTIDMQAVHLCPRTNASALYYSQRLKCHNYTIFDLATLNCSCYWWHEAEGGLSSSIFTTMLVDYLKKNCLSKKLPIKIYSDGCCYQNRNNVLANALLSFAVQHNVAIEQKWLIKGHTQMECDSVHSTIERKLKNKDIHLPSDYARLSKEARIKPFPYKVYELDSTFFLDYEKGIPLKYNSIRPGKYPGDPVVTDLRGLLYDPEMKEIHYKLSFAETSDYLPLPLPRKRKLNNETHSINIQKLYNSPPLLALSKYNDLQEILHVLPKDTHTFYKSLQHETELKDRKNKKI